ncbi:MAG TPA: actin-binding WH2 domain-containing protein, partial [Verrucomicrobiota bacterium]|nr:actin-binding WH2 domain-containing protein [Verrucomicrobiota bacterium]
RLLVGWLAANLLLGAQLAWIGRPYFGHPNLPVEFLRADAWSGNFFEAVVFSARALFNNY